MQTFAGEVLLRLGIFATKALRHEGKSKKGKILCFCGENF
jgi:hypothetical protein